MSQLSRLIEQARKTRNVNDIFKFQPAVVSSQAEGLQPDMLQARLAELEHSLFANPAAIPLPIEDVVSELETIASLL